jgi:glycosyltransferase involved in cell wall biosynthesis
MSDRSVRVLRIITRLNIGGPAIQAVRLSTALTAAGFDTCLVHGRVGEDEGDMGYLLPDGGAHVRCLPALQRSIAPARDARAFLALFRQICEFRPHIVHTHMAKAGLLGRLGALLFNITHPGSRAIVIHTYHGHVLDGYFSPFATAVFIALERLLARVSDVLISVSERVRDDLVGMHRIAAPERFRVVPLGLDLDELAAIDDAARRSAREALGIPANAPVVTTVGRLTAIKQHTLFLDVAKRVTTQWPDAVFLIVGDGELRAELEAAAQAHGLSSQVRFLGWRRDLTTIYGASDVFLLTSRNEGTPVALIEAMASGVPGVATDVGGVRDVVPDPDRGSVRPFGDADGLAEDVNALLADPVRRAHMATAARQTALARFRFGRLARDIESLYRELLARRAAGESRQALV